MNGPILLSGENVPQPATYDLVFVPAHHPDGDQYFSDARPLDMDRRIAF
jgi:hypothetical protein